MTLRELLNDAIQFDEPGLAYAIYWASMNGLSLDQDFETLKKMNIDFRAVDELVKSNPLGIKSIKLFSCKESHNSFHLILAKDEKDARSEIFKRYNRIPNTIHDVSHGMDNSLWDDVDNKTMLIRGIKDAALVFPHYIGLVERTD